jgi:hypothetical protein
LPVSAREEHDEKERGALNRQKLQKGEREERVETLVL